MSAAPAPAATATVAARTEGLTKIYGRGDAQVVALGGVTVAINAHEFTAVMGPSGSGKSTLMHCAAGLDEATSGRVFIGDAELTALNEKELTRLRRDRIGFIFQAFNLIPTLTAKENILLPLSIAGRQPDPAWFDQVIDTVGLRERLSHRPTELSGGQQQRVACARALVSRALVSRPDIIFADEPTGNLDSHTGAEIVQLFHSLHDEGATIVMITHDQHLAAQFPRRESVLDGKLVDAMVGAA